MLIIYTHPNRDGHCGEILQQLESYLGQKNIDYEILDLYDMSFNPVLGPGEHYTSGNKNINDDVAIFQEKIKKHHNLVFIYPTWWNNVPSMLKGFSDRVFYPGFAFRYKNNIPIGLLKDKRAVVFTTTGAPKMVYRFFFGSRSVKVFVRDTLRFCGIKSRAFSVGGARRLNDHQKKNIRIMVNKGMRFMGA